MMRTWLLFLALASVASAECIDDGRHGAHDARTNTDKGAYQQCHWETIYNDVVQRLWDHLAVGTFGVTIPTPQASDDGVPMPWTARVETTLQSFSCLCTGTCTTPPTYAFKTLAGAGITTTTLTCAVSPTAATPATTTDPDAVIPAGKTVLYDTTNTPSGDCTYCVLSFVGAETLP